MAYSTVDDVASRLSQYDMLSYLDWDGDGVLDSTERQRVTEAITFVDKIIDGRLAAAGKRVIAAGVVIRDISIWLAVAHMPKRGQQAAWIESMAKSQMGVLDMICRGGDEGLRIDDEVGPIAPTSGTGSQGPVVSNPKVEPGKGISWS